MLEFLRALTVEAWLSLIRLLSGQRRKSFSRVEGTSFTIKRGKRGSLSYVESGNSFVVNASEGDGYSILVEEMGDVDLRLDMLPIEEKLRIARNIRDALLQKGVDVEVIYEHRPLLD